MLIGRLLPVDRFFFSLIFFLSLSLSLPLSLSFFPSPAVQKEVMVVAAICAMRSSGTIKLDIVQHKIFYKAYIPSTKQDF